VDKNKKKNYKNKKIRRKVKGGISKKEKKQGIKINFIYLYIKYEENLHIIIIYSRIKKHIRIEE